MERIGTFSRWYEAKPGEKIQIEVEPVGIPPAVTFSKRKTSGTPPATITQPSASDPVEVRELIMPAKTEVFTVTYDFPASASTGAGAFYRVTLRGDTGANDVHKVRPNPARKRQLPYTFKVDG